MNFSLLRLSPGELSEIGRCPYYRGVRILQRCPYYRGVRILQRCPYYMQRCPYYRGVRKERSDCSLVKFNGFFTIQIIYLNRHLNKLMLNKCH